MNHGCNHHRGHLLGTYAVSGVFHLETLLGPL